MDRSSLLALRYCRLCLSWLAFFSLFSGATTVRAVIFYASADSDHNTTPPTGALVDSGWQWVGLWGGYQGTAIGPNHFITANHVGGEIGLPFVLNGVSYPTVSASKDPLTDLRIVEVSGTFPSWAPLYRAGNETGRDLVVFGRGLIRGAELRLASNDALRGWYWGAFDGRLRWGRNTVKGVVNGGVAWGQLLYATFDVGGIADEAHLAQGDSGGAVFINDGGGWKMAGVAAVVDGPFSSTAGGATFYAALFDLRGLYSGPTLISGPQLVPSGFYAMRISDRLQWIDSVVVPNAISDNVDVPFLPASGTLVLCSLLASCGGWFLRSSRGGRWT